MGKKSAQLFETAFSVFTEDGVIGEGGSGRVFRAKDESGQAVAIKVLDPSKSITDKRKRFKNEINFSLRCQHPNIVLVIDHGVVHVHAGKASSPFYVMPLYGASLRTLINRHIPSATVLSYFGQILNGVEAAHLMGVVHRDLKPENVLIDESSSTLVVADFGIALFGEELLLTTIETSPVSRLANFQYAAPEQRVRGGKVDSRADIYALGLMLNEMFTGQIPIGTDYTTIESASPEHAYLDAIVSKMLRQNPNERPGNLEQVKQELAVRGAEFITRQRLSELKQVVVAATELDDPLIEDPPRLFTFDWNRGILTLILSRPVNPAWISALQNMGSHTAVFGKGPGAFRISGNKAVITATENEVQRIIDHFKEWLPNANRVYEQRIRRERTEAEERERQSISAEIAEQDRRQRLLSSVKI